jgi:hypothetical protein
MNPTWQKAAYACWQLLYLYMLQNHATLLTFLWAVLTCVLVLLCVWVCGDPADPNGEQHSIMLRPRHSTTARAEASSD